MTCVLMLSLQSLGSAQKSSWSRDSSSSPLSHIEEDHVYRFVLRAHTRAHTLDVAVCVTQRLRVSLLGSFPNKQKSSDSSTAAMTSALGSNLSELDRLLLELNAVQQSSPSFATSGTFTPPPASRPVRAVHTQLCVVCPQRNRPPLYPPAVSATTRMVVAPTSQ